LFLLLLTIPLQLLGVLLYPNLGLLFIVSPIACTGFLFFLQRIKTTDIDHEAARGLERSSTAPNLQTTPPKYLPPNENNPDGMMMVDDAIPEMTKNYRTDPSFKFGFGGESTTDSGALASDELKAMTPFQYVSFRKHTMCTNSICPSHPFCCLLSCLFVTS
jgi:hypothetical protein